MLNITAVKVRLAVNQEGGEASQEANAVVAHVSIELDSCFVIHQIKVLQNLTDGHLYVKMPSRMIKGKRVDIVHPLTTEVRVALHERILAEYEKVVKEQA